MAIRSVIERLARAFLESQRAKLGIPAEERATAEAADVSLLRRAQAAKAMQEMGLAPARQASQLGLETAQTESARESTRTQTLAREAQAEADRALAEQRRHPTKQVERTVDYGDRVRTYYTDGTVVEEKKGIVPHDPRATPPAPGRLTPLVDASGRVVGSFHNVTGEVRPIAGTPAGPGTPATVGGTEVRKSPLPAAMQQASGMAQTVKSNVDQMDQLADKVTAGPGIGHLSKLSQSVMGPSGPEGVFDFLGNATVDLVYIKSGKQINEQELKILRGMIPNRARGNVKEQVRLFRDYANSLLRQYGVPEEGETAPGVISPNVQRILDLLKARDARR